MKTLASRKISIPAGSLASESTATSEVFDCQVLGYPLPGFAVQCETRHGVMKELKSFSNALLATLRSEMPGLKLGELVIRRLF
jgi:hypothetical protein